MIAINQFKSKFCIYLQKKTLTFGGEMWFFRGFWSFQRPPCILNFPFIFSTECNIFESLEIMMAFWFFNWAVIFSVFEFLNSRCTFSNSVSFYELFVLSTCYICWPTIQQQVLRNGEVWDAFRNNVSLRLFQISQLVHTFCSLPVSIGPENLAVLTVVFVNE